MPKKSVKKAAKQVKPAVSASTPLMQELAFARELARSHEREFKAGIKIALSKEKSMLDLLDTMIELVRELGRDIGSLSTRKGKVSNAGEGTARIDRRKDEISASVESVSEVLDSISLSVIKDKSATLWQAYERVSVLEELVRSEKKEATKAAKAAKGVAKTDVAPASPVTMKGGEVQGPAPMETPKAWPFAENPTKTDKAPKKLSPKKKVATSKVDRKKEPKRASVRAKTKKSVAKKAGVEPQAAMAFPT